MSKLEHYFKSKNLKDAIIKQLKDIALHANTAVLHLVDDKYNDAYSEIFIIEALSRSLRFLFDAIEGYARDEPSC